jgi:hypothetical protein
MTSWLVAVVGGVLLALLSYRWRGASAGKTLLVAVLRALALTLLIALLLDAVAGFPRPVPPIVALDVSASWLRGGDAAAWSDARKRARSAASDTLFLMGDSVRPAATAPDRPTDAASRVRPLVERALSAGRPLRLFTDGEVDDPEALASVPAGSQVVVIDAAGARDAAVGDIQAPRAVIGNDTAEFRIQVVTGRGGSGAGSVSLVIGNDRVASIAIEALAPFGDRTVSARAPVPNVPGSSLVHAIVSTAGDAEPRNDTLTTVLEVSPAAGAVLVSTSPDLDSREALALLRGALALPTRGFYRIAPGVWRQDGSLAAANEADIRAIVRDAPLVVLHGDTGVFGAPRAATKGALVLFAPPPEGSADGYATGAPPSPISAALSAAAWDSLPPLDVAGDVPAGEWVALETRRGRRFERRNAIVGREAARRTVIVGASGFWRWRVRGGAAADAFGALWGGLFDWLSAGRTDARAAVNADAIVHAGDPVRWRRGAGDDSVVTVTLTRRGGPARADSMMLRFTEGDNMVESKPLATGVYDVQTPGGNSVLAVNASRELYPRRGIRSGAVGRGSSLADAPRLRSLGWVYAVVIAALCIEWLLRRRLGLR